MSLGQGYATPLSEKGSNLSGGQRQRIAIARTILNNPQLLVMDEATSALDYDTERQLCLNLQGWAKNRTVFFITHRLSTIKNSEIILVMHQGRLAEQGNHQSLMASNGRYATLFKQQEAQLKNHAIIFLGNLFLQVFRLLSLQFCFQLIVNCLYIEIHL